MNDNNNADSKEEMQALLKRILSDVKVTYRKDCFDFCDFPIIIVSIAIDMIKFAGGYSAAVDLPDAGRRYTARIVERLFIELRRQLKESDLWDWVVDEMDNEYRS